MAHTLLSLDDWARYDQRDFAGWFNQLQGLRSPVLVGTRSAAGVDNVAIFNSLTHIGARPPLLALVFRPLTVERHTYANLRESGVYTINHVTTELVERAHITSAKLHRDESEFDLTGLTAIGSAVGTPYVAESPVSLRMRFVEEYHVAANDTVVVIGRVEEVRLLPGAAYTADRLRWGEMDAAVVSGLYSYYRVEPTHRLGYVSMGSSAKDAEPPR